MITFLDGPAEQGAKGLLLRRAPLFLRVTRNHKGEWDALDQLTDQPSMTEDIFVYRRVEYHASVHLCRSRASGTFQIATYRYLDQQPPDDVLRSISKWQAWAKAEAEKKEAAP